MSHPGVSLYARVNGTVGGGGISICRPLEFDARPTCTGSLPREAAAGSSERRRVGESQGNEIDRSRPVRVEKRVDWRARDIRGLLGASGGGPRCLVNAHQREGPGSFTSEDSYEATSDGRTGWSGRALSKECGSWTCSVGEGGSSRAQAARP